MHEDQGRGAVGIKFVSLHSKEQGVLEFYQNQFSAICVTVVDKLSLSKLTQGFPHISGAPAGRYN